MAQDQAYLDRAKISPPLINSHRDGSAMCCCEEGDHLQIYELEKPNYVRRFCEENIGGRVYIIVEYFRFV